MPHLPQTHLSLRQVAHPAGCWVGARLAERSPPLLTPLLPAQALFHSLVFPQDKRRKKSPKMPLQFQPTVYHHHTHTYHVRVSSTRRETNFTPIECFQMEHHHLLKPHPSWSPIIYSSPTLREEPAPQLPLVLERREAASPHLGGLICTKPL